MEIEHVYGLREYLKSLYMFKLLDNEGIDISPFFDVCELASYDLYSSFSSSTAFMNFSYIAQHLFEIFDVYESYDDDSVEEKKYWLHQAGIDLKDFFVESTSVIVILDPSLLNPVITGDIGEDEFSGGNGELLKIDEGIIVHYDLDYGELNWAEILETLIASQKTYTRREENKHAMAV